MKCGMKTELNEVGMTISLDYRTFHTKGIDRNCWAKCGYFDHFHFSQYLWNLNSFVTLHQLYQSLIILCYPNQSKYTWLSLSQHQQTISNIFTLTPWTSCSDNLDQKHHVVNQENLTVRILMVTKRNLTVNEFYTTQLHTSPIHIKG